MSQPEVKQISAEEQLKDLKLITTEINNTLEWGQLSPYERIIKLEQYELVMIDKLTVLAKMIDNLTAFVASR